MLQKSNKTREGVLNDFKNQMTQDYIRYNDWRIFKHPYGLILEKAFYRGFIFKDEIGFIEKFLDKLYNREFTSILCGGLGLGIAPFLCQSFCNIIDVVEIDAELIHLVNTADYLSPKVNMIHGDFFTYEPQQKYDVILADIWQHTSDENFEKELDTIVEKYILHINEGGLLYLPIADMIKRDYRYKK
jgi:hypothetical protein